MAGVATLLRLFLSYDTHTFVYICVYICIYVYMYIYIYIFFFFSPAKWEAKSFTMSSVGSGSTEGFRRLLMVKSIGLYD